MAFISYTYTRYDPAANQYIYTLTDSDFGAVDVGVGVKDVPGFAPGIEVGLGIVREYSKRSLPICRNLALFILYMHKERGYNIANTKRWQDEYCPKYIENWAMYAKGRDKYLEKLLALM